MREAWVQDLRTKQLEPILKFYAPDAAFLQPNGERITGLAALRTLFQTIMSTFTSDLTLHSQNLETSGDLAYDSGDFQETLTIIATGAKLTSKGSYVIIFKRPPGGSWHIVQQVWTGTPPPGT
jgi:ketosteroid isomerase-like protein